MSAAFLMISFFHTPVIVDSLTHHMVMPWELNSLFYIGNLNDADQIILAFHNQERYILPSRALFNYFQIKHSISSGLISLSHTHTPLEKLCIMAATCIELISYIITQLLKIPYTGTPLKHYYVAKWEPILNKLRNRAMEYNLDHNSQNIYLP